MFPMRNWWRPRLDTWVLKPVWSTRLKATARVVKRTKQLGLIECEIVDPKGSLVARVYTWFGLTEEDIPYFEAVAGRRAITAAKIKADDSP